VKSTLQKTCFILLLITFSTSYAGSCFQEIADMADCKVKAEEGHFFAQHRLGTLYDRGVGVPQDHKQAVKWFRKSAEQGFDGAQLNLGWLYQSGEGVPQDHKQAAKWIRKAAEQGFAPAQYSLSLSYAKGNAVPEDYVLAHMYANLAAANGSVDAVKLRESLATTMTRPQLSEAQKLAREWMKAHP